MVRARMSVTCEMKNGSTAIKPRKSAPPQVIRRMTLFRYSWVGRPGRMPGMNPPFRCRFSARRCC